MQRKRPKKANAATRVKKKKAADLHAELLKLRGKVKFTIDLETMRDDRA